MKVQFAVGVRRHVAAFESGVALLPLSLPSAAVQVFLAAPARAGVVVPGLGHLPADRQLERDLRFLLGNTLALNMDCQRMADIDNRLEWALVCGPVQAVYGTSRKSSSRVIQNNPSVADRLVLLTPLAMYEILRVAPDGAPKAHASGDPNELEVSTA